MNSLVKVFSNFKEFYSEINGATLTGAIDVVVVEQPDGSFLCSPFHVRFGKLGVLRSRQKIVDIEVNGEPVDIHMKLGESGEAFFVQECPEDELEKLPANMATSPLPTGEFNKYGDSDLFVISTAEEDIDMPKPRRNSIDFSKESEEVVEKKFDNQVSDFSHRRHTDTMERRNFNIAKKEFTTQKIRQEWASHEGDILGGTTEETWPANGEDGADNNTLVETSSAAPAAEQTTTAAPAADQTTTAAIDAKSRDKPEESESTTNDESKSKKKRRKKSSMKKKQMQRKSSSSSSETSLTTIVASVSESLKDSPNVPSLPSDCPPATEWHADAVLGGPPAKDLHERNTSTPFELDAPKDAGCNKTSSSGKATNQDVDFEVPSGFSLSGDALYSPESTFKGDTIVSIEGSPIQSDNELELSQAQLVIGHRRTNSASWKWGELPTRDEDSKESPSDEVKQAQRNSMLSNMFSFMKQSKSAQLDGVYLSDLDTEGMDPEVAALYFPQVNKKSGEPMRVAAGNTTEDDRESGKGTSLPNSPSLIDGLKTLDSDYDEEKADDSKCLDFVAMSLCGGLENGSAPTDEQFDRNVISYHEVCQNPAIFSSPLLVVRLNGKYFSWAAACPIVMTIIAYQKPLSNDAIEQLMQVHKIVPNPDAATAKQPRGYSWWTWRRSGGNGKREVEKQSSKDDTAEPVSATEPVAASHGNSIATQASGSDSDSKPPTSFDEQPLPSAATSDIVLELSDDGQTNELYRKSLRLTTEQIESLNLNNGINEISFSVTTAYQGTSRCTCYLFRWKHDDKVVISDIDGTITKSDVLGHILPMVGRDWAQIGVAQLFSKIEENGYKMLYLSARAIGQSRATRDYLRSIRQGDVKLPDGPLLLNPTSLISALHREVIEKKPEQFKIACLSDISDLFPDRNPFYAGYGNRINDVWAYRAVGIPIMRIFTINPKGELKHELTQTFQSSYCNMTYIADQLYPPINTIEESVEFSNFNYWREPVLELDDFTAAARTSPITTSADGAAHDASTQTSPAPPPTTTDSSSPQSAKNLATIPEHRSE